MALSEDSLIANAMTAAGGPPSMPGPDVEGTPADRQALLKELARPISASNTPQMRAALQRTYDVTYGGQTAPPAVARSMRDGFPDAPGGGGGTPLSASGPATPAANDPWATPLGGAGGTAANDIWATPLDMPPATPQEGVLARASRVLQDPEGGVMPAVGSVVQHVLGGDSAPSKSGGVMATAADLGRKAIVGVNDVGESIVGLGDLVTGGTLGDVLSKAGYDPRQGDAIINGFNSEAQQHAEQNVAQAQGFVGTLKALAVNPRAVFGQVVEALPGMAALGAAGATAAGAVIRAAMPSALEAASAAGLTGEAATKFAADQISGSVRTAAQAATAGALGAQTAGSVAETGRAAGQDYGTYAGPALLSGLATVGLSYGSKIAAQALGVGDLATDLAGAASKTTGGAFAAGGKELVKGAAENAGFGAIQTAGTNAATGLPIDQGLGAAAASAGAVGGLMSGVHGMISHTGAAPAAADPGDAALGDAVHPLQSAVDAYLNSTPSEGAVIAEVRNAPTVDDAITAMDAHSASASALLAAAVTERDNTRASNNAQVDADNAAAAAQAAVAPAETPADLTAAAASETTLAPQVPASAAYADLTPMDERTAQGRLTAMRGMNQQAGDETGLNVVPHPGNPDKFAIGRVLTAEPSAPADEIPTAPTQVGQEPTHTDMEAGAPPKAADVLAAMKVDPALRTPEQRITMDAAARSYAPELMSSLQKRATAPFSMTAEDKVRVSELKASEVRKTDEQVPPVHPTDAVLASAGPEGAVPKIVRTNTGALPDQAQAKNGELSKQSFKVISQIARIFGKKLVVYENGAHDGFVRSNDPQTIYLNRSSSVPHLVVFGHELLHTLRADSPAAYEALVKTISVKEGANTDVPGIRGNTEELTADLLGNRFKDPKFWAETFRRIAEGPDPSASRAAALKLGAVLTRTVGRLVKALGGVKGFDTDGMVNDLDGIRKAAVEALAGYAKDRFADAQALDRENVSEKPAETNVSEKHVQISDKAVPPTRQEKQAVAAEVARREMGTRFSEARGAIDEDDVKTSASDKAGNRYDITLHREMLGDQPHSVYIKAENSTGDLAGMVDFNVRHDGALTAGITHVEPAMRGKGVAEMLYRAARAQGYDVAPSGTYTPAGRGLVESLKAKGVINRPEQGRGIVASEKREGPVRVFEPAQKVAEKYMAGREYAPPASYAPINAERSKRIAAAFDAMKHNPDEPATKASYGALVKETLAQYRAMRDAGVKVEFAPPGKDMYAGNPRGMINDVRDNKHMWVTSTGDAFGSAETSKDNPLLAQTPYRFGDKPALVNDIFRATHDYFGHVLNDTDFSAAGEQHAWRSHAAMYSPEALPALTTETRGQNAWQWYGPHGEDNTARGVDHKYFADQKVGLMPAWTHEEGRFDNEAANDASTNEEPKGSALLNVGMHISDENGGGKLTPQDVKDAVAERDAEVTHHEVHNSNTEPTMVARLNRPLEPDELHGLSARLRQDAIAQRTADGQGRLEGPKAEDWGGAYNPDYFLRMDGRADAEHPDAAVPADEAVRASARRDELDPDVVQTLGKHIRDLLPDERMRLRGDTAQTLVDSIREIAPSVNEMAAVAYAGRAKRGWYEHSTAAIDHVFGPDAPRFASLLAALSPRQGVEPNLEYALKVWRTWVNEGRPVSAAAITDIIKRNISAKAENMKAWTLNATRALSSDDPANAPLSGPKVNSFFKNLRGHMDEVTNDGWMAAYADVDQALFGGQARKSEADAIGDVRGKSPGYMAMSAQTRAAAKMLTKLTGDDWSPAEVQETIWSWSKTLREQGMTKGSAVDFVKNKGLTDALLQSTPDFRTLFHTDVNERTLRDAGLGDRLGSLRDRTDLGGPSAEEPSADREAAPFAPDTQQRLELTAARRFDAVRARGTEPVEDGVRASETRIVDDNRDREYTPEQRQAFANIGRAVDAPSLPERLRALRQDIGKRVTQGLVDQFAPIKDLGGAGYLLARLSKGAAGAFDAFLNHGKLSLQDGVYDADMSGGAIDRVFKPLGNEAGDFLSWIAGNRAERLTGEGRENLFSPEDIAAYKSLDKGLTARPYTLANGEVTRDRSKIYPDALRNYNEFNRNALDMAEQSGLIDKDSRKVWENEMYVPFYRVADEDGGFLGNNIKNGLVRQKAFEKLKGGSGKLNSDLLANTLQNWSHLIDAAAKNRAARATLEAASAMGIAAPGDGKKSVWYLDNGEKKSYQVSDPYVLAAINSLESVDAGPVMKAMSTFKHWMTIGATASPAFKIRHLIRGSMTAMANSGTSLNPIANAIEGFRTSSSKSQTYVSNLASGGLFHFGTMLDGDTAANVRKLVSNGVDHSTILDSDAKIQTMMVKAKQAFDAYNDFSNRGEEMPRTALYAQLRAKGQSHAEASLAARDLLDYSLQGSWPAIRMIAQTVPFMNARAQGLYKLGRAGFENPARMATVLGALSLASVGLAAANAGDKDMDKREDFDVDNFWGFKIGNTIYRIPKPFELGAAATLAERTVQAFTDPEMTKGRFLNIVGSTIGNQLNMNPIPQAVKPILDLYANKDSFTGRPIETDAMQKMQSSDRYGPTTSLPARALGAGMQQVMDATGMTAAGHQALSPVQIDHLVGGYFGWLGSSAVTAADMLTRPLTDTPAPPTPDYLKMATGQLAAQADSGQSRYITEFYDQARVLQQALGTFQTLVREGKIDEARNFMAEHASEITAARGETGASEQMSKLNAAVRRIQNDPSTDADTKRTQILALRTQQSDIAERVTATAR